MRQMGCVLIYGIMEKNTTKPLAALLASALILISPGLGCYEALARTLIKSPVAPTVRPTGALGTAMIAPLNLQAPALSLSPANSLISPALTLSAPQTLQALPTPTALATPQTHTRAATLSPLNAASPHNATRVLGVGNSEQTATATAQPTSRQTLTAMGARIQGLQNNLQNLSGEALKVQGDRLFMMGAHPGGGDYMDPTIPEKHHPRRKIAEAQRNGESAEDAEEHAPMNEKEDATFAFPFRNKPPRADLDFERPSVVKIVSRLRSLQDSAPALAVTEAQAILQDSTERRVEVRLAALRALTSWETEEAVPFLLDLLNNEFNWYVAWEAMRLIGEGAESVQSQETRDLIKEMMSNLIQLESRRRYHADLTELNMAEIKSKTQEEWAKFQRDYRKRTPTTIELMAENLLSRYGEAEAAAAAATQEQTGEKPAAAAQVEPQKEKEELTGFWKLLAAALTKAWYVYLAPIRSKSDMLRRAVAWGATVVFVGWLLMPSTPNTYDSDYQEAGITQTQPGNNKTTGFRGQYASPAQPKEIAPDNRTEEQRLTDASERTAVAVEVIAKKASQPESPPLWLFLLPIAAIGYFMVSQFRQKKKGGAEQMNELSKMSQINVEMEKPDIRFSDVAGIDDAIIEVMELYDYMKEPQKYLRLGGKMPKGVMLDGPPGNGKTLLAKALAGETDSYFIALAGSDFDQQLVGVGAARIGDAFKKARAARSEGKKVVIFIDEIDAIGEKRGSGIGGSGNAQTINKLLSEMDGFKDSSGILIMAATNRPDTLDDALMRPGRFDRKVHVRQPDILGREAILQIHARSVPLNPEVQLLPVAERASGMGGAALATVVNEATMFAARGQRKDVMNADLDRALNKVMVGGERNNMFVSPDLRKKIAYHEAGHVITGALSKGGHLPAQVTIMPHGSGALGFAQQKEAPDEEFMLSWDALWRRMVMAAGGLAAERKYYQQGSTGPGNDLEQMNRYARMLVKLGYKAEDFGYLIDDRDSASMGRPASISESTAAKMDEQVISLTRQAMAEADKYLEENTALHEEFVEQLMERETLGEEEIAALFAKHGVTIGSGSQ
jgi:ATP-dependent metalloprotease FtsH